MMLRRPFQAFEVRMSNDADNVIICSLDQMASVQVPQPVSNESA
jgi:hypothetical protein